MRELWDYRRYGVPARRADRYFYLHNDGLQDQPVLYVLEALAAGVAVVQPAHGAFPELLEATGGGRLGRVLLASARVKWYRPPEYYSASRWRGTLALDGGAALLTTSARSAARRPSATASINACKLVPEPETITTSRAMSPPR